MESTVEFIIVLIANYLALAFFCGWHSYMNTKAEQRLPPIVGAFVYTYWYIHH